MMRRWIETGSLFVLLSVVVLRPLVAESYDFAGSSITEALEGVWDPTPLRTIVFDVLILIGVCGWLVGRAIGPARRYQRTGLEWGVGLILIAAVISCIFAGNKRLAVNASIDWVCLPLMAMSLTQLLHRRWHRRLALAAVLATACAQTAQCFEQTFAGFTETWEHYQSIREEFWSAQGVELDSPRVGAFERRIKAREASGFLPHSNVTGSYLVLCGLAAMGVALEAWRSWRTAGSRRSTTRSGTPEPRAAPLYAKRQGSARADQSARRSTTERESPAAPQADLAVQLVGSMVLAMFILTGAVLTGSLGAILSGVAGIGLWILIVLLKPRIDANRTRAVLVGWAVFGLGACCLIGYGLSYNRLPGWSMTFRWHYWKPAARMIADNAWTGVGRENFGRHYLRYKPIESPEEVANPHNLFVQSAADWGLLGLMGMVLLAVGVSLALARHVTVGPRVEASGRDPPSGSILVWLVPLGLVVTLGRLPLLGTDDPNFLYYAAVTTGSCWIVTFALFAFVLRKGVVLAGPQAPLWQTSIAIGLFAFALHDLISFALFVPQTATTLFALLGVCLAGPCDQDTRSTRRTLHPTALQGWAPVVAVAVGIGVVAVVAAVPLARAGAHLTRARLAGPAIAPVPATAQAAPHHYLQASLADPIDPTPHLERARWLIAAAAHPELRDDAIGAAEESLQAAIRCDPQSPGPHRLRVKLYTAAARSSRLKEHYERAIQSARDALTRFPLDPNGMVTLANCLFDAGTSLPSKRLLRDAVETYRRALALDDARPLWAGLRQFSSKRRVAIEKRIEEGQRLLPRR